VPSDRTHHFLTHLALALAGVCLTCAELPYLPELVAGLLPYLFLIGLAWYAGGPSPSPGRAKPRLLLAAWQANLVALLIAGGAALWVAARLSDAEDTWASEIPLTAIIIPYLGPVLMAVLVVKLFRPPTPGYFWQLQSLGLLQVGLGCVLASGVLFGVCLILYLVVVVAALTVRERRLQVLRGSRTRSEVDPPPEDHSLARPKWWQGGLSSSLIQVPAVAALTVPLFLLAPKVDAPEWDPLAQFGVEQSRRSGARTGFSEEIDTTSVGVVEKDDTVAFTVQVSSVDGRLISLSSDQRWRGIVLDRYDEGVWRAGSEMSWPKGAPSFRSVEQMGYGPRAVVLKFRVPHRAGTLFLADPALLGPKRGELPVVIEEPPSGRRRTPMFFEAGGTVAPLPALGIADFRYTQVTPLRQSPDRYAAVRVTEIYRRKLLDQHAPRLEAWTLDLLLRLAHQSGDNKLVEALERRRTPGLYLPPGYWERVARMLSHHLARSGEYTYGLDLRRESMDLHPVLDFLKNVKHGHCERYASALALALRTQGIPARIVKGHRGAEYQGEGIYQVRNSFAHAWVEALVPSTDGTSDGDWLVLDPTPGAAPTEPSALEQLQREGKILWRDLILGYNSSEQADLWDELASGRLLPVALLGLALLAAPIGLVRLSRRGGRAPGGSRGELGSAGLLYARLRRLLERYARLAPRLDETPAELAARAEKLLANRAATADFAGVPARVVEVYYSRRYGNRPPTAEVLREVSGRLDELAAALRR
jgi:hypothetical protein